MFIFSLLIFSSLVVPSAFSKEIYVIKKPDGSILITNRTPPKGVKATVYRGNPYYSKYSTRHGGGSYNSRNIIRNVNDARLYRRYQQYIKKYANHYHVSESLVKSVIHAESCYNPYAVSRKGAQGLMQLMPYTARELGVRNPFIPRDNIEGGTKLLAKLLKKYNGDRKLAVAAYNAGPGAVDKYNGIPPYKETKDYVTKVLALQMRYEKF